MRVGIIGCGNIGNELALFIDKDKEFELIALNDVDKNKVSDLISDLRNNAPKFMEVDALIKNCGLIIESANKNIIHDGLSNKNLDKKNKKLLIMSTGGLISNLNLVNKIKNCEMLLPSGAIAGLDAIKSVSGKIESLTLTTTKPVKGLESAPYVLKNNLDLKKLKDMQVIFDGSLNDAVEGFPQNINVAATLFLASQFKNIKIRIIADPNTQFNTHEIEVVGSFGRIKTTTNNLPSKNPKTSYLAVLSAINLLKNLKCSIKVGN